MQPASVWLQEARERPVPQMLFSEFCLEGELCMLFADTNLGKSILAVQLGDSISRGVAIPGFRLEAAPQKVRYVDFELGDKQFEVRYAASLKHHYAFSAHFLRAELVGAPELAEEAGSFEALLHAALEKALVETAAKVLIIDNIPYLSQESGRGMPCR